jgi:hypothetical protein
MLVCQFLVKQRKSEIMKLNQKPAKSFFGTQSSIASKSNTSEQGDFFLYNSIEDERELHLLLDAQIKQSMNDFGNYED